MLAVRVSESSTARTGWLVIVVVSQEYLSDAVMIDVSAGHERHKDSGTSREDAGEFLTRLPLN